MSDFKEVWYVLGGEGEIPKGVEKAVCQCEVLIDDREYINSNSDEALEDWFRLGAHSPFIQAYTLGQKRRRVECPECKDSEYKGLVYCGGYFEYRKCPACNGTGKTWEYE